MPTSSRRSCGARIGLLTVALLHLLATTAMPFTHGHPIPAAADVLAQPADSDHGGAPSGHSDACTICRTLGSAQPGSFAPVTLALPAVTEVAGAKIDEILTSAAYLNTFQARAPPRV